MSLICSDIESMLQNSWILYHKLEVLMCFYWWWTWCFWEWECFCHLIFMLCINVQKISICLLWFSRCLQQSKTWMFYHDLQQVWWEWLQVLAIIRHTWETEWMNWETYERSIIFEKFWSWILYEKISWTFFSSSLK